MENCFHSLISENLIKNNSSCLQQRKDSTAMSDSGRVMELLSVLQIFIINYKLFMYKMVHLVFHVCLYYLPIKVKLHILHFLTFLTHNLIYVQGLILPIS